jgi:hypothetical protein
LADLRALEEMGVPTTVEDLAELAGNDTETLQIYAEAASKLKPSEEAWKKLSGEYANWDPSLSAEQQKRLIEGCKEAIPLIEKAAARENFSFGRDWNNFPYNHTPEYWRLRIFAWIMLGESVRATVRDDVEDSIRWLKSADGIRRHLHSEPTQHAYRLAARIHNGVSNACSSAIWNFDHDPGALAKLETFMNSREPFPDLRRALIGNVAIGRVILSSKENFRSHVDLEPVNWASGLADSYFSSDQIRVSAERRLISTARWLFSIFPSDPNDIWGFEQPLLELEQEFDSTSRPSNIAHSYMWISIDDLGEVARTLRVRTNLPKILLRLARERAKTGKLPAKLPDYGDLTIDPFTGGQLTYKLVGKGFYLYSFGPDKMDDGGENGKEMDIALRVHG